MSTEVNQEVSTAEVTTPETKSAPDTGATQGETAGVTAAADSKEAVAPVVEDADPTGKEVATPIAYKAREKFKVMDPESNEQKEYDVPEYLKGAMKDAVTEKEVIALLEKAYGIEPIKALRTYAQKERDQVKSEFSKVQKSIQDIRTTYQRGDIDAFLEKLAIPQERMLQWALDKVNYSQLPPEQQKVLDERTHAQRRAWEAEQQAQGYGNQLQEQVRQAKSMLLEAGLARPDVKTFAEAYDARVGKTGAFAAEVVKEGEYEWIQSQGKVDLTPDQAIERAKSKWQNFIQPMAATTQAPAAQVVSAKDKPTVIPNISGKSQSPMRSKVRSVEDLKKLRDQGGVA